MSRKDDHIKEALKQPSSTNDFDRLRLMPSALNECSLDSVSLKTQFLGRSFDAPIMINAMTGGTAQAEVINEKLAKIASRYNIPMAVGSLSGALKNDAAAQTFDSLRSIMNNAFLIGNLGAEHGIKNVERARKLIDADAMQIHLNPLQELIMPEGDTNFKGYIDNIRDMHATLDVPLIVKEVGFGLDPHALKTLKEIGVDGIDVSGRGGTDFKRIENARRDIPFNDLNNYGLSTVESLLEASQLNIQTLIASGGVRSPYDVIKALSLGATMVGLSGWFLKLVHNEIFDSVLNQMDVFFDELKRIMCALGAHKPTDLRQVEKIYDAELYNYIQQRQIKK